MLRRLRQPTAGLCAALLLSVLAACGGQDDPDSAADPAAAGELDEVSFSGEVGESITAEWSSAVEAPKDVAATTLVEGDGETIADGDTVSTYLWVGNGTAQEQVFSDYDNGAPESLPNDPEQLGEVFAALLEGADLRLPGRRGRHDRERGLRRGAEPVRCRSGRQPGDRRRPGGEGGGRADAHRRQGAGRAAGRAAVGGRGGRQARRAWTSRASTSPRSTPRSSASSWRRGRARP